MCYNIVWKFQNIALGVNKGSRSGIKGDVAIVIIIYGIVQRIWSVETTTCRA